MLRIKGVKAGEGVVLGRVNLIVQSTLQIDTYKISALDLEKEIARFENSLLASKKQILDILKKAKTMLDSDSLRIFDAHLLMLEDPLFRTQIIHNLNEKRINIESIVDDTVQKYVSMFSRMPDTSLQDKAADMKDIGRRILLNLTGKALDNPPVKNDPFILIAEELIPSQLMQIDREKILGIGMEKGGKTSHVAIFARALGKPVVVGLFDLTKKVKGDDEVVLDADKGEIIISPTEKQRKKYTELANQHLKNIKRAESLVDLEPVTIDGKKILLKANIDVPEDMETARKYGACEVGLFRTEYLFMNKNNLPTEEEQFKSYRQIVEKFREGQVDIRVLDAGGDKKIASIPWPKEENPTLGWRGIRVLLDLEDIFTTQLRAILRASAFGKVRILLPMINRVDEIRKARMMLDRAKTSLDDDGHPFDRDIQLGVMIETPAAAEMACFFAPEADFFSIGTNDLIQFTLAVDRMSEKVDDYYEPLNPAMLRILKKILDNAEKTGKSISVCGEMASDSMGIFALMGLGYNSFSVNPAALLGIKGIIRNMRVETARILMEKAQDMVLPLEIENLISEEIKRIKMREDGHEIL